MQHPLRLLAWTAALVFAITCAHQVPQLLSGLLLPILFAFGFVFVVFYFRCKKNHTKWLCGLLAIMLCAFAYTQMRASYRLQHNIPQSWVGTTFQVAGTIDSIPLRTPFGVRFLYSPSSIQTDERFKKALADGELPKHISLNWYDDDLPRAALKVGQEWRLPLHFKPPRATQNEGVFDLEQLWWANNIRGAATVRVNQDTFEANMPQLIATHKSPTTWLHNARMTALQHIDTALAPSDREAAAVFKALTLGEQSEIKQQQWQVFQQTGITHLISISGLHITMLAGLCVWCVHFFWRKSVYLCALMPSMHAAQWAGLLLALLYALLAGWALPAQRTVYMLALWLFFARLGVAHSGLRVLCWVIWGVLLLDPFAVLTIGFWLSFGAVAWLMLSFQSAQRISSDPTQSKWYRIGMVLMQQITIGTAMLPITLYFFHQASWLGVWVNLIAIPLVSVVLVPMLLLACVVELLLGWSGLMLWANALLAFCLDGLTRLTEVVPHNLWVRPMSLPTVLFLTIGGVILLRLLRERRWRWASGLAVLMLALSFWPKSKIHISAGEMQVHVLDVGQGSAVLLQTAQHNWLYDTGARYGEDSDAGARIIVPYLQAHGVERIDTLVLSHNDSDHTGGALSVLKAMPVGQIFTSMSVEQLADLHIQNLPYELCTVGQKFELDGVMVQTMSPDASVLNDAQLSDNSKSCVLRIEAKQGQWQSMLLTGDIDGLREAQLVVAPTGGVRDWQTDVLMVPHHGSGGSSTAPLLEATQPKMAFVQAGYLNAFHHPHERVVQRYHDAGVPLEQTVASGTLRFCIGCERADMLKWREMGRRYWWTDEK